MPSDFKPKVVVDTRENQNIVKHLEDFGAIVELKQLLVGDYICSERVGIEKKTISDFLGSIVNQRIFTQIADLKQSYERPVLMIEGNPEVLNFERNVHPNAIRGVLSSIAIDYSIPIMWTANTKESAGMIHWIAKREQDDMKKEIQIRAKTTPFSDANHQEFIVAGLPTVSNILSRRLLKKFKTVKKVFSAKQEQLMKIDGIGEEKAKKIWEMLNKEYED